jgi:type I restriction enzyme, S subunit
MAVGLALAERVQDLPKAEGPWPLPAGWKWAKIESVLLPMEDGRIIHHGWSPQCEVFASDNVEVWGVLKTTAVQAGAFLAHENKVLPSHLVARANLEVHAGDLLLTCAGPRSRCGVACLVRETRRRLIFSGKMYRFRTAPNLMEAGFLEAFLQTSYAWQAIDAMKTGGSDSGLNLTHDRFRQLLISVPPLAEQRRIVSRLDELFVEIAIGEAALATARTNIDMFRRALLKAAVTGELTKDWRTANPIEETGHAFLARLSKDRLVKSSSKGRGRRGTSASPVDVSTLPSLPDGWTWATLENLAISGPTNGYSPKKSSDGSGTLALKLTATTKGQIDLTDRAVKFLSETIPPGSDLFLKPGDLLFQRGNTVEYVGIAAVYEGPSDKYIYPDLMIRVRTPIRSMTEWIWRVANSPVGRKYMMDNASGTAGTMPKISGETLRNFPVPIPPAAEADEILRRVSDALAAAADVLATLDAEAADVARLKQSILKAAFEGSLTLQDPADDSASVSLARLTVPATPALVTRARVRKPQS